MRAGGIGEVSVSVAELRTIFFSIAGEAQVTFLRAQPQAVLFCGVVARQLRGQNEERLN